MQVTFLGTGQLHPADRVQCGILLEDVPVLVDCGAGVYQRLFQSKVAIDDLEHVFFTHLHEDHVSDLVPLANAKRFANDRPRQGAPGRRGGDATARLTVHGPPGTAFLVESLIEAYETPFEESRSQVNLPIRTDSFGLSVDEISPGETRAIEGQPIETVETKHGRSGEPTLAYRFGDDLVVTGDTGATESVGGFADGVRVLVHECTFFEDRDSDGHSTPGELAQVLEGRDIDELYLTHLPDITPGERRAAIETIRDRFDGNVTVTRDMDRLSTR